MRSEVAPTNLNFERDGVTGWDRSYRSGILNYCPLISEETCGSQLNLQGEVGIEKFVEHPGLYNFDIMDDQEGSQLFPDTFTNE